jgi:hypothetical protein
VVICLLGPWTHVLNPLVGVILQSHLVAPLASDATLFHILSGFLLDPIDPSPQLRTFMTPDLCNRMRDGFTTSGTLCEDDLRTLVPSLSLFDCQINASVIVSVAIVF